MEDTLDDALRRVIKKLLNTKNRMRPTRGEGTEFIGVLLKIKKPRSRLSRTERKGTVFSCLGETLWYLSGTKDLSFITYYIPRYKKESDDCLTVHGGYGPRLFNKDGDNQVKNVLDLLGKKPSSRRAVIQLFDAKDIASAHTDIPCTCTFQFLLRGKRLHMFTNMRSNDAFFGLPHDVFAFTMIQEILARSLGVEPGIYNHAVGSLHLYDTAREGAKQFLSEGFQSTVNMMPPMPVGDPWESIGVVLKAESDIRNGKETNVESLELDTYWVDMLRILQIFSYSKQKEHSKISGIKKKMSTDIYNPYIEKKQYLRKKTINNETR